MNRYKISNLKSSVRIEEIVKLFMECGWGQKYSIQSAKEILKNNNMAIFARDNKGKLVGLLRILNEGSRSANVMDVVIHPRYSSSLITSKLVNSIKKQFKGRKIYIDELNESSNYFFINRGFKLRNSVQTQQVQVPWFAKLFGNY